MLLLIRLLCVVLRLRLLCRMEVGLRLGVHIGRIVQLTLTQMASLLMLLQLAVIAVSSTTMLLAALIAICICAI